MIAKWHFEFLKMKGMGSKNQSNKIYYVQELKTRLHQ